MKMKRLRTVLALTLAALLSFSLSAEAFARGSTCETGNEATFETLEEARVSGPEVVPTYEGNNALDRVTQLPRVYTTHPVLDMVAEGTTYIYRSPNMYGGKAAARLNTTMVVYTNQHFKDKDAAFKYITDMGLVDIINEAIGSIILVTPIGDEFGSADVKPYYALQTAIFSQGATGLDEDGNRVYYADPAYFGGFDMLYFIGVDGGATFFNNYIATSLDFAGRIAGALLAGGDMEEVRQIATCVPVYLADATDKVIEKYKAANSTSAVKGDNNAVCYYNQSLPLQQVIVPKSSAKDLKALVRDAYYNLFVEVFRMPVMTPGLYTASMPYFGYTADSSPYSLSKRNALINGVTKDGIHLIKNQKQTVFADVHNEAGEYIDAWYEYIPEEVLNGTAPDGTIPLILANHGGGDDPRHFVAELGLLTLAGEERVAVVAADHSMVYDIDGDALTALAEYILDKYPALDRSRVYATGYSMGGIGTYKCGFTNPELFAAIAPLAGANNAQPTDAQLEAFDTDLPILMMLSAYDTGNVQGTPNSGISAAFQYQLNLWAGLNEMESLKFDFDAYPYSGFKGDSWKVETLNGEHEALFWYLNNDKGVPMVSLVYVKNLIHQLYPQYAKIVWSYVSQFSRDQETGEIIYNPYR